MILSFVSFVTGSKAAYYDFGLLIVVAIWAVIICVLGQAVKEYFDGG